MLTPSGATNDAPAFEKVDGKEVTVSYLDQMSRFLRADAFEASLRSHPQRVYQGNFLNDGILARDILQTGMAQIIFQHYWQELSADLQTRLDKEKYYTAYQHPYAGFIAADNIWQSFAPDMKKNYDALKTYAVASEQEAFNTRINLYLAERNFPPAFLKQMLYYQEKQYEWLPHDPNMVNDSLTLFGYKDAQDWFGPRFMQLSAQVIINSAAIAKQKGYKVTRDEALADIIYHSELAFKSIKDRSNLNAKNGYGYLQDYMRLTQMDENTLVNLWQDVLLFRRLFNDIGASVLVDALTVKDFNQYVHQAAEVDTYQLASEFQFKEIRDVQRFELYLDMIAGEDRDLLLLPQTLRPIAAIENEFPELIEKRYWVELATVNKNHLQAKVGVKETWDWEVAEANWQTIKKQFPELAIHVANTEEERLRILDQMDEKKRQLVDKFARAAIVDAHGEWLEEALTNAASHEEILALSMKGSSSLEGIKNAKQLALALEASNTGEFNYSQDQVHFYRIKVKESAQEKNIISFSDAINKEILDKTLKTKLDQNVDLYDQVFVSIQKDCANRGLKIGLEDKKQLAAYRFYSHIQSIQNKLTAQPETADQFLAASAVVTAIIEKPAITNQWKLQKVREIVDRSHIAALPLEQIIKLGGQPSAVCMDSQKGAVFYQFIQAVEQKEEIAEKLKEYQELLASEAKCNALREFLSLMEEKKALTLKDVTL